MCALHLRATGAQDEQASELLVQAIQSPVNLPKCRGVGLTRPLESDVQGFRLHEVGSGAPESTGATSPQPPRASVGGEGVAAYIHVREELLRSALGFVVPWLYFELRAKRMAARIRLR